MADSIGFGEVKLFPKSLQRSRLTTAKAPWKYLDVHYEIAKEGSGQPIRGELMPMVANDGPHYGDNLKLQGAGKYHLRITMAPPGSHFGRHTDKETGVGPWFAPFTLDYEFAFTGLGKKGGY
jgi:periplasmic iron binding protein